jgi:hypothetical protein
VTRFAAANSPWESTMSFNSSTGEPALGTMNNSVTIQA